MIRALRRPRRAGRIAVSSSARIELLPRGRPLYSIPQAILRTHFKCSAPTIDRVANSYAEKDDVTKDQEILTGDPDYTAARKALLDAKYRAENPASVANKEYDSDDTRSKRQGRRVTKARDTPGNTPKAQSLYHLRVSGSPAKSLSNPVKCAASSVCTTPDPPAVHAMSEARFLLPFVTKIPLDAAAAWHIELERKKFTQAKLRAMAKIAATDVDQLIAKLLPQMDEIDRFLLVSAIKALNPTV
ncbi:hypothetical protein C8R47DRAFT_803284 [Mycena vitilis]|nr:hypothetical protein C8R47DRAFT_803284 [Mycena vitilis]